MFNPKRTPPKPLKASLSLDKSTSDSELISHTQIDKGTGSNAPVAMRKRQRPSDSPNSSKPDQFTESFSAFMIEIKEMLESWKVDYDSKLSLWKKEQDAVLSILIKDVADLKSQCIEMKKTNVDIENSMNFIGRCYEDMKDSMSRLEQENNELKFNLNNANNQVQNSELHSRSSNIELRNVPRKEKESTEDLLSVVSSVGKAINMDISASNLRNIYRLLGKTGSTKPIVAEFLHVSKRNEFLACIRKYNKERPINEKLNNVTIGLPCEKKPIYAEEQLTPSQKQLFFETRQYAKDNNHSSWSVNGKIFIRLNKDPNVKPLLIKTKNCLSQICKQK